VSLGVVSDVFEVMAQVDRRLTKVNSVDMLIRVKDAAENRGRHSGPRCWPNRCGLRRLDLLPSWRTAVGGQI
jgi:hypothetical protein